MEVLPSSPASAQAVDCECEAAAQAHGAAASVRVRPVLICLAVVVVCCLMGALLLVQQLAAAASSPPSSSDLPSVLPNNLSRQDSAQPAGRQLLQILIPVAPASLLSSSAQPSLVCVAAVVLLTAALVVAAAVVVFLRAVSQPCSVLNWRGAVVQAQGEKDDAGVHQRPSPHRHSFQCVVALACRAVRCVVHRQWPWAAASVGLVHATSGAAMPGSGWKWTTPGGELSRVNFFGRRAAAEASSTACPSSLYHAYVGLTPVVVLSSLNAVTEFYAAMKGAHGGHRVRDSRFSVLGSVCDRLMGQSMGVKSGQDWDNIRKTFAPHFHPRAVSAAFDGVHQAVADWLRREMEQGQLARGVLDVRASGLHLLPLQVIGRLVYGDLPAESMRALERLCSEHSSLLCCLRQQLNRLPWLVLRLLRPSLCARVLAFQRDWREFNDGQVQRLLQQSADSCILSRLLSQTAPGEAFLGKAEWMDTIDEILLLNHDVTYIAIMAALTQLAVQPAVQEKLRAELRQSRQQQAALDAAESTGSYSISELAELRYLDAVVLESARCWPSIQLSFPERTAAACVVDGFVIPAHSVVVVDAESVNHDSAHWPEPDRFDPDRFLNQPQLAQRFHRFGLSTRQCLGQRFAGLLIKLVLAHVVSRYRLRVHSREAESDGMAVSASASWSLSMRDVKSDGLPYLTAYSQFPLLYAQPVGELALTSALLPDAVFQCGLQRLVSGSGIGVLGMSLGNSFFSRPIIARFIPFLLCFLSQLWIFIPDVPAECTYAAMGYNAREVKQKTRYNANRYRNWIRETVDALSPDQRSRVRVIDWRAELSGQPVYQQRLAAYQRAYQEQQCPAFTSDAQDTTMAVLSNRLRPGVDRQQALQQGVDFLLMELAFLTTFHYTLTQSECNQRLVYIYHRRWPVFERLMQQQYALTVRHDSSMAFVMVDTTATTQGEGTATGNEGSQNGSE